MKLALLLAACGDSAGTSFDTYCADFGKNYTNPTEYAKREQIFEAAVAQVEAHNAGDDTFKLGINHLSDYTKEELKALRGFNKFAHRRSLAASNSAPVGYSGAALPDSIDWVAKGATTPVKNQGGCGTFFLIRNQCSSWGDRRSERGSERGKECVGQTKVLCLQFRFLLGLQWDRSHREQRVP